MKSVYKYMMTGKTTVFDLPAGSEALAAGWQDGEIMLWFLVDIEDSVINVVSRTFIAFATGEVIDGDISRLMYTDSVMIDDGKFVWHIFEELNKPS